MKSIVLYFFIIVSLLLGVYNFYKINHLTVQPNKQIKNVENKTSTHSSNKGTSKINSIQYKVIDSKYIPADNSLIIHQNNELLAVTFQVINRSNKSVDFPSLLDVSLRFNGTQYIPSYLDSDGNNGQISPGKTKTKLYVFDVPKNDGYVFLYQPFMTDKAISWKL